MCCAGLTHGEVLAQSILFLLAGHSTTANTLAFITYLLALNADCQEKLVKEIEDILQGQVCFSCIRPNYEKRTL